MCFLAQSVTQMQCFPPVVTVLTGLDVLCLQGGNSELNTIVPETNALLPLQPECSTHHTDTLQFPQPQHAAEVWDHVRGAPWSCRGHGTATMGAQNTRFVPLHAQLHIRCVCGAICLFMCIQLVTHCPASNAHMYSHCMTSTRGRISVANTAHVCQRMPVFYST